MQPYCTDNSSSSICIYTTAVEIKKEGIVKCELVNANIVTVKEESDGVPRNIRTVYAEGVKRNLGRANE